MPALQCEPLIDSSDRKQRCCVSLRVLNSPGRRPLRWFFLTRRSSWFATAGLASKFAGRLLHEAILAGWVLGGGGAGGLVADASPERRPSIARAGELSVVCSNANPARVASRANVMVPAAIIERDIFEFSPRSNVRFPYLRCLANRFANTTNFDDTAIPSGNLPPIEQIF